LGSAFFTSNLSFSCTCARHLQSRLASCWRGCPRSQFPKPTTRPTSSKQMPHEKACMDITCYLKSCSTTANNTVLKVPLKSTCLHLQGWSCYSGVHTLDQATLYIHLPALVVQVQRRRRESFRLCAWHCSRKCWRCCGRWQNC
jgi:hypothetical protein